MKKVQLINAPLARTFCPSIRAGAFPPLHLAALASFVRNRTIDSHIEIIDGEIQSIESIVSQLDADIVGISCNSLTYESALKIGQAAKESGALVVLGGAHPTFVGRDIIKNRSYVDVAVHGDGELALLGLVQGKPYGEIPNLIYRDGSGVRLNGETILVIGDLPDPDYSGLSLEPYHQNYANLYPDKPFRRAFAAYSAKGCQWRDRSGGGCTFCAIQHLGFRIKPFQRFWRELTDAAFMWHADFFWDVSDTFTMQREWVRDLARSKPREANFRFQVYGRSTDIDEEMADLLASIGVYEAFLGLESGSNVTLRASRKGTTIQGNLRAIKNLNRAGVRAVISIVLGLPGESEKTLNDTKAMVEELVASSDLSEINCSILLPLPGSRAMQVLRPTPPVENDEEDLFDPDALRKAWVEQHCMVSYGRLIEIQGEMRRMHCRVGTFGLTTHEAEEQKDDHRNKQLVATR
jgi:anaerobic magnesium-protoporphyrin IX monomethyl ester cyclase